MKNPFEHWIDVFAAGKQTDSAGVTREFTESDLDSVIANHSAADAAPAVVGHPKNNDPAFGWTQALRRVGNVLQAKFEKVAPEFADAVGAGHYAKRSVRIAPDGKGGWRLLHVGWLGAAAPAVSGLAALNYEAPDDSIEFESPQFAKTDLAETLERLMEEKDVSRKALADAAGISESTMAGIMQGEIANPPERRIRGFADALGVSVESIKKTLTEPDFAMPDSFTPSALARFMRRFREWALDRFNLDTADRLVPQSDIDVLDEQSRTLAAAGIEEPDASGLPAFNQPTSSFSQATGDDAVSEELKTKLQQAQHKNQQLEDQLSEFQRGQRQSAADALVQSAVAACKLSPAQAAGLAEFAASLEDATEIEFSAASKLGKKTPAAYFADFISALPVQPVLKELAEKQAPGRQREQGSDFAVSGATVNPERAALHAKAKRYAAEHKCDFLTAVKAVELELEDAS